MFIVGSVRASPFAVSAGESVGDGGSASVGTSCSVGDRGLPSLTVVSVSTSASMPVMVGLGKGREDGLKGFGGISVRTASGSGMAVSPPRSCNANCPFVIDRSAPLTFSGVA